LTELRLLAETAGAQVRGEVQQRRGAIRSATYLSKGKIEEIRALTAEEEATLLLLDEDLSPAQTRNLEETLKVKVVDRSGLILDIFARRARTRRNCQVELAQLRPLAPAHRMWEHLSRLGGHRTGPGETNSRWTAAAFERIAKLKRELEGVVRERRVQRRGRRGFHRCRWWDTPTRASRPSSRAHPVARLRRDQLFATSIPRRASSPPRAAAARSHRHRGVHRKLRPSGGVVPRDPGGVVEADLLLHVVNATNPTRRRTSPSTAFASPGRSASRASSCSTDRRRRGRGDAPGAQGALPGALFASALTPGLGGVREAALARLADP
jgi:GTP-binding protein HflX